MDFSVIFQLRTKKFWWMDVIFYLVISLLIAALFCYFLFWVKNGMIRKQIQDEIAALQTVGTDNQRAQEKEVILYQRKIGDFTTLLKGHEFASNVFAFMQAQTMPSVWFRQFGLEAKTNGLQLAGEAESMDAFSRQVAAFEKNKYIKNVGTLNSLLGDSARVNFNLNLTLDQNIFSYLDGELATLKPAALTEQPAEQQTTAGSTASTQTGGEQAEQAAPAVLSVEKSITSFRFLLDSEVIGVLDQTNYKIVLNVPYNTDLKNLTPSIIVSPGATVVPASNVSQDFTSPVTYIVTAQDGSVQSYEASVTVSAPPETGNKSNKSGYIALIVIVLLLAVIAMVVAIVLFLRKKKKNNNLSL